MADEIVKDGDFPVVPKEPIVTPVDPHKPHNIGPVIGIYDGEASSAGLKWIRLPNDTVNFGVVQPGSYSAIKSIYIGNNLCVNKAQYGFHYGSWGSRHYNEKAVASINVSFPSACEVRLKINEIVDDGLVDDPFTHDGTSPQPTDTEPYKNWLIQASVDNGANWHDLSPTFVVRADLAGGHYDPYVDAEYDSPNNYVRVLLRIYVPADAQGQAARKIKITPQYTVGTTVPPAGPGATNYQNGICSTIAQ